jgi:hypothetical protein
MKVFIQRLREPSTWAGLSVLGLLFGIDAVKLNAIAEAGVAVAGVASVLLSEKWGD